MIEPKPRNRRIFSQSENPKFVIDFAGILKVLTQRYPFLLVDGIIRFEKGKSIVGQKEREPQ